MGEVVTINSERIWSINSYIQQKGQVHLRELMQLYPHVSAMTIRRDIDYLEKQGHVVRTRGGAKSINHLTRVKEDAYSMRAAERTEAKMAIAQKALGILDKTGAVFFDAGTTVMSLACAIDAEGVFAVTSAPNIALELTRAGASRTVLLGGNLNRDNLSVSGASALEQIKNINISTAFIATSGFSLGAGFTNGNFDESELKRLVVSRASKVVMLVDSGKLDINLPYTFARLADVDYLVCETAPHDDVIKAARDEGVTVL